MRKCIIIFILLILLTITGCKAIVADVTISTITETTITQTTVNNDYINLKVDYEKLLADNFNLKTKLEKYQNLIASLNSLLSNVYYMECSNSGYTNWGTGFSIEYNNIYYILTAGHYVEDIEYNTGKYSNFRFKVNNVWVYPKLLDYKVTDILPDYAVFYSDQIKDGFDYDLNNSEPDYRLDTEIPIQENNNWGEEGSCGSPVIDLDGQVIGLHVGYLQDIDEILQTIDNLK